MRHLYKKITKNDVNSINSGKIALLKNYDDTYDKSLGVSKTSDSYGIVELNITNFKKYQELNLSLLNINYCVEDVVQSDTYEKKNTYYNFTNNLTYYECEIALLTGKTHQIRMQLSAINMPIVGDLR